MRPNRSRWLVIVGLVLMVGGVLDPLEGSVVILAGSVLAALGACFLRTKHRLPAAAMASIAVGVAALFGLSSIGGVGGNSGRSIWWLLLCLPYPIGWILGLIGAAGTLNARPNAAA